MSIHSFSFNAPLLLEEASVCSLEDFGALRKKRFEKIGNATPAVGRVKAIGHWSEEWDSLLFLDPVWTDQYMAMGASLYTENVLPLKELELLFIAFDACAPQKSKISTQLRCNNVTPPKILPRTDFLRTTGFRSERAFILTACENELRRGDGIEATTQLEARIAATLANMVRRYNLYSLWCTRNLP